MADQECMQALLRLEEIVSEEKHTADVLNLAAWGVNGDESGPLWVSFHSRAIDRIDQALQAVLLLRRTDA